MTSGTRRGLEGQAPRRGHVLPESPPEGRPLHRPELSRKNNEAPYEAYNRKGPVLATAHFAGGSQPYSTMKNGLRSSGLL